MPTLLTILGVIMFLREGWVIGNSGLLGGLLIITLAFGITGATGLSLSSLTPRRCWSISCSSACTSASPTSAPG